MKKLSVLFAAVMMVVSVGKINNLICFLDL
jgi:hypothetical protein